MKIIRSLMLIAVCGLVMNAQTSAPGYARWVNPLIGTQKMGHTFPGATVPFGAVQLSPDTDQQPHNIGGVYNKDAYKYCAGYQYDDREIVGFSHTHFSGTGHSDLGDFLIMPTVGALQLEPGKKGDPASGFRSGFSHANETAEAGYYRVRLDDDNILAEMTATTRVGMHQYTFLGGNPVAIAPGSDKNPPANAGGTDKVDAHIILDLMHGIYNYDDKNGMIATMGGSAKFTKYLDELFTMHLPDEFFAETEDVTREGIIGGYVHGNEPAHHAAYLYNWTDESWKTQERVRMILKNQYRPTPDGLGGNDDCGQMSAWYLFTALGFYPVAPGSGQYALGSPVVKTAALKLENGKVLNIEAVNQSEKNVYVSSVELNGRPLNRRYITFDQISKGGKLVFRMSATKSGG